MHSMLWQGFTLCAVELPAASALQDTASMHTCCINILHCQESYLSGHVPLLMPRFAPEAGLGIHNPCT